MESLGEDILLLAVRADGKVHHWEKLHLAFAGSELIRLSARGRVEITGRRITVLDDGPTGDANLDAAVGLLAAKKRYRDARTFVARVNARYERSYHRLLEAAGVISSERRKALGLFTMTRWTVLDRARLASVRARLDAIADSSGQLTPEDSALAGLVFAIGLHDRLYPEFQGRPRRRRLEAVARRTPVVAEVRSAAALQAGGAGEGWMPQNDGSRAAVHAAGDASVNAATDTAIAASVGAAVHAAIDAAVHAAVDAAHSASSDGGGGHHH